MITQKNLWIKPFHFKNVEGLNFINHISKKYTSGYLFYILFYLKNHFYFEKNLLSSEREN